MSTEASSIRRTAPWTLSAGRSEVTGELSEPAGASVWAVVATLPGESPALVDELTAAGIATYHFEMPKGATAERVRLARAAARSLRDSGFVDGRPVCFAAGGKSAAVMALASRQEPESGLVTRDARFGRTWFALGGIATPALLLVDPTQSSPMFARATARRFAGTAHVERVDSTDLTALIAGWRNSFVAGSLAPPVAHKRMGPVRRLVPAAVAATLAATMLAAPVAVAVEGDSQPPAKTEVKHHHRAIPVEGDGAAAFSTGSRSLIDGVGMKWFVNTNITFNTTSSASGAMSEAAFTASHPVSTLGGGTVSAKLNDAFDGYNSLYVDTAAGPHVIYNKLGTGVTASCPTAGINRLLTFPTATVGFGGLEVTRKIYVSPTDGFARWENVVHNPTGAPINATVGTLNNLGSDSNTKIIATSSGDATVTTNDLWATSMQNWSGTTSSDPRLGHVFAGAGAVTPVHQITFVDGNDLPTWNYAAAVPAGGTVTIVNFATGQNSNAASASEAAALSRLPASSLQCMDASELASVQNFEAHAGLSAPTYSVSETGGSATVTVTRPNGANLGPGAVNFATSDGTAKAGTDYTATSGTATFADGATTATFAVPILVNDASQANTNLNVTLSTPTGALQMGTQTSAVLTIQNVAPTTTTTAPTTTTTTANATTTTTILTGTLPVTGADPLTALDLGGSLVMGGSAALAASVGWRRRLGRRNRRK